MRYIALLLVSGGFLLTVLMSSTAEDVLTTPLQQNKYERLTTHEEMHQFVDRVSEDAARIEKKRLGTSVEGRDIPYLKISSGVFGEDDGKLTLLLFAQQHGNEPSGMEASLKLLQNIAEGEYDAWLDHLDILLVPQVNPDGAEVNQRRNADGVDLNRSHFVLNAPETIALRSLFHEWHPEVTLDVHEYYPWASSWLDHGYVRLFDEQFGTPTNINSSADIRRLTDDLFLPFADSYLRMNDFSFHNYLVGSPDYIRYSTSDINDGRQSFGMMNTFSLILEGKRSRDEHGDLKRRTAAQVAAIESLLKFSAEHKSTIRETVNQSRSSLIQGETDVFVLTMDRQRSNSPLTIPVQRIEQQNGQINDGDTTVAQIDEYYPTVAARRTTDLPDYYLIPGDEHELINLLELHHIDMDVLEEERSLNVERYQLGTFLEKNFANATYQIPNVEKEDRAWSAEAGDVLVPTSQLHRHVLATVLEPESKHGLLQYEQYREWQDRAYFPVLRVIE